jgi:Domain of unknown function (DUF4267)
MVIGMRPLEIRSAAFVLGALLAAFMFFIAFRGLAQPVPAAAGFGIPLADVGDGAWLAVKGGRDLGLGLLFTALLVLRDRRGLRVAVLTTLAIPVNDAVQVVLHDPSRLGHALAVHGSAVAFALLLVALLRPAAAEAGLPSAA